MSSPCKPLDLYWRVGKFIYPRGGSVLLHHMPLHQFHLEEGLNVSAIMSLRLSRQSSGAVNLGSLELSRWLDLTQAEAIAKLCMAICPKRNSVSLTEIDPGLGLVFEAIKVQLHSSRPDTKLEYSLVGGERWLRKFSMLHADDDMKFQHVSSRDQAGTDVVILNHTNGVRESSGPSCTPLEFAATLSGSGVMAARVVDGERDQLLTTIAGTEILLPSLSSLLQACAASGGWRYRYLRGHDSGYFLPSGPTTGLVMAYRSDPAPHVPRFVPIGPEVDA